MRQEQPEPGAVVGEDLQKRARIGDIVLGAAGVKAVLKRRLVAGMHRVDQQSGIIEQGGDDGAVAGLHGHRHALAAEAFAERLIARACDYALRIWSRLEVYLEDGQIQIDNNAAERSIPMVLGGCLPSKRRPSASATVNARNGCASSNSRSF